VRRQRRTIPRNPASHELRVALGLAAAVWILPQSTRLLGGPGDRSGRSPPGQTVDACEDSHPISAGQGSWKRCDLLGSPRSNTFAEQSSIPGHRESICSRGVLRRRWRRQQATPGRTIRQSLTFAAPSKRPRPRRRLSMSRSQAISTIRSLVGTEECEGVKIDHLDLVTRREGRCGPCTAAPAGPPGARWGAVEAVGDRRRSWCADPPLHRQPASRRVRTSRTAFMPRNTECERWGRSSSPSRIAGAISTKRGGGDATANPLAAPPVFQPEAADQQTHEMVVEEMHLIGRKQAAGFALGAAAPGSNARTPHESFLDVDVAAEAISVAPAAGSHRPGRGSIGKRLALLDRARLGRSGDRGRVGELL